MVEALKRRPEALRFGCAIAEEVPHEHRRDIRSIAPLGNRRQTQQSVPLEADAAPGHHVAADRELRGGAVNARSRARVHARSAHSAEAFDGAEHSAILVCVMAASQCSVGAISLRIGTVSMSQLSTYSAGLAEEVRVRVPRLVRLTFEA